MCEILLNFPYKISRRFLITNGDGCIIFPNIRALSTLFLSIFKTFITEYHIISFINLPDLFNNPRYFNALFVDQIIQPSSDISIIMSQLSNDGFFSSPIASANSAISTGLDPFRSFTGKPSFNNLVTRSINASCNLSSDVVLQRRLFS